MSRFAVILANAHTDGIFHDRACREVRSIYFRRRRPSAQCRVRMMLCRETMLELNAEPLADERSSSSRLSRFWLMSVVYAEIIEMKLIY